MGVPFQRIPKEQVQAALAALARHFFGVRPNSKEDKTPFDSHLNFFVLTNFGLENRYVLGKADVAASSGYRYNARSYYDDPVASRVGERSPDRLKSKCLMASGFSRRRSRSGQRWRTITCFFNH